MSKFRFRPTHYYVRKFVPPLVKTEAWDNDVVIVSGVELSNPALRQSLS